ncbi:unnamed protein product [Linum tenue]|uniref:Uncharacterized protein n=1 Tax=Linum tenue TaxID=586396 RepID=A0AAV0IZD3_9ROSI|nr:unnamed protein product [Linum tenue]
MRVLPIVPNGKTMMPLSVTFLQQWWRMCTNKGHLLFGRQLRYYDPIFILKLKAYKSLGSQMLKGDDHLRGPTPEILLRLSMRGQGQQRGAKKKKKSEPEDT